MTLLLYFNPDWREADGGALRLHRGGAAGAGPPYEDVLPVAGRLVAFFSRTVWHEVLEARARAVRVDALARARVRQRAEPRSVSSS